MGGSNRAYVLHNSVFKIELAHSDQEIQGVWKRSESDERPNTFSCPYIINFSVSLIHMLNDLFLIGILVRLSFNFIHIFIQLTQIFERTQKPG